MKIARAEEFLKSLVDSASATAKQSDVRRTHKILAEALTELGFKINWVRDPSGKTDDLMVAERAGKQGGENPNTASASHSYLTSPSAGRFITCVSHIDTVLSPVEAGPYRREETAMGLRARGAGIIDNKGGLAVLVESLRLFFAVHPDPSVGFRVVSSPDEENGSSAWHTSFADIGARSHAVLGFEPALDDGSIISSRRGNRWYNIEIMGIEAHAGRCKGEELNAAHEAARLTVRLLELRDLLRVRFNSSPGLGVSLHVGHIEGGRGRHNVVCGNVQLKLDTRFSTFDERDTLHGEILKIIESPIEKNLKGESVKIRYDIVDDCPPFAMNAANEDLVSTLAAEIAQVEKKPVLQPAKAGGAGDVNHMSRPGLLVLDGLGPVGGRMHTTEEFLELATLQSRAEALAAWYPQLVQYILAAR